MPVEVNESEKNSFELSETRQSIQVTANIVFVLLTIVGNSLVCAAYHQNAEIRTPSNMIVLSMAYCDLLMVLSFVMKIGSAFTESNIRSDLCLGYSSWGFVITSLIILHLCAISIDRLVAVKYSLRYNSFVSRGRVSRCLLGVWLFGILEVAVIPMVLNSVNIRRTLDREIDPCMTFWNRPETNTNITWAELPLIFKTFSLCIIFLVFVLPILTIVLSYCYIWRQALIHSKKIIAQKQAVNDNEKQFRLHMKCTKTFAIVIGVFLLCFVPVFVVTCKRIIFFAHVSVPEAAIVVTIAHSSAIWNPMIYAWRNREFRRAVKIVTRRNVMET